MRSRSRTAAAFALLAIIALVAAVPQHAAARGPDRTCGIPPGDGAYSYVAVWNVSCRTARKVSRKAGRKFCGRQYQRCRAEPGDFRSGRVRVRGWKCKMRVGYEYYRARCRNGDQRFLAKAAA